MDNLNLQQHKLYPDESRPEYEEEEDDKQGNIPPELIPKGQSMPKRHGRPKGSKNRETLRRAREAVSGGKVIGATGIKSPPEFKHRVAAGSLKDTYSAANRVHQHELDTWKWKCEMIRAHNSEHGLAVSLPDKPKHPFDEKQAEPSFGEQECLQFLTVLSVIPAQLGLETRPNNQATVAAAGALAKLLRHYPTMDTVMTDWMLFALAGVQWSMPWIAEYKSRRDGTWMIKRGEFQKMGLVAPDQEDFDAPKA